MLSRSSAIDVSLSLAILRVTAFCVPRVGHKFALRGNKSDKRELNGSVIQKVNKYGEWTEVIVNLLYVTVWTGKDEDYCHQVLVL